MARPTKVGIPWFPLNVDVFDDEKFVAMNTDFGSVGELAIIKLYCMIYDKGYYIKWEPLVRAAFVRRMSGEIDKAKADEIVDAAAEYGIFDRDLFIDEKVLTCRHVQEVFANATTRRTGDLPTEFWLLDYAAGSKKKSGSGGGESGESEGGGKNPSPKIPSESPEIDEQMNQGDNDTEKSELPVNTDINRVIVSNNAAQPEVIASKSTQSRVEYSIVDNSKEEKKKKNINKRDQKPAAFDPYVYEFSFFKSGDFTNAWREFCDHRKAIKKPLSQAACNIIHKQLSTETEAVAVELLNKTVSSGWTGVKPDWMKDEEKDKINKQALAKELGEIDGVSSSALPIEIIEERKKRQQRYETYGSSSPHELKDSDPFPLELSIFHQVNGFPNDLRDNIAEIIKQVKELPTKADLVNYSYRVPLHRYPHKTKYFQNALEEWRQASSISAGASWEKMPILCAYIEPVASQMLLDAAKEKSIALKEIAPERLERMKKWFEPQSAEDAALKDKFYTDNELAWFEFRRREHVFEQWKEQNPDNDETEISHLKWPDYLCTFHEDMGGIDRRRQNWNSQQNDIPKPKLVW
jgi:hypothetical protein